jgi:hypothetical protein
MLLAINKQHLTGWLTQLFNRLAIVRMPSTTSSALVCSVAMPGAIAIGSAESVGAGRRMHQKPVNAMSVLALFAR